MLRVPLLVLTALWRISPASAAEDEKPYHCEGVNQACVPFTVDGTQYDGCKKRGDTCKATWTDAECAGEQSLCPTKACDGSDTPWCMVTDDGSEWCDCDPATGKCLNNKWDPSFSWCAFPGYDPALDEGRPLVDKWDYCTGCDGDATIQADDQTCGVVPTTCVFPFTYDGVKSNTCAASYGEAGEVEYHWCPKASYDGVNDEWEYCRDCTKDQCHCGLVHSVGTAGP